MVWNVIGQVAGVASAVSGLFGGNKNKSQANAGGSSAASGQNNAQQIAEAEATHKNNLEMQRVTARLKEEQAWQTALLEIKEVGYQAVLNQVRRMNQLV